MKLALLSTAAAALLAAGTAQAAVVTYSTPIPITADFDGVYVNFATGASARAEFAGWDFNPYAATNTIAFYWGGDAGLPGAGVSNGQDVYQDLANGTVISFASNFSQSAQTAATVNFRGVGVHTLGFRFLNEATNAVNYGFLRLQTGGTNGFPATILGWSFENSGGAITVAPAVGAAVPEPATWGLMLAGFGLVGAGLRSRRRAARVAFA